VNKFTASGRGVAPAAHLWFTTHMKTRASFLLALALAVGSVHAADDKKTKPKPPAKSDKNTAQKAESSVTDWADKNNIWKRSPSKKSEKK
jgi:hypothetical protein